jgi:hydroxypyruvate isomerase
MEFGLCIEMAFADLPFEERIRKAARCGFKNVEMWFVDMSFRGEPEQLAQLARTHGVTITNTVIGSPDGSVGGGLTSPANRAKWLDRAARTIEFTKRAGIPATIVCTGNEVEGAGRSKMLASILAGLRPTVEMAEKAGVTLLLEPLNTRYDHPGYFLTSSAAGADICRKIGSPRLKLLFDCYHMQIMEGDLVQHIERNLDVIGHFHSAGVPGRHELYQGETDYPFLLAQIEKMGYRGVFGLEYQPSIDHEESVRKTLAYLKR